MCKLLEIFKLIVIKDIAKVIGSMPAAFAATVNRAECPANKSRKNRWWMGGVGCSVGCIAGLEFSLEKAWGGSSWMCDGLCCCNE